MTSFRHPSRLLGPAGLPGTAHLPGPACSLGPDGLPGPAYRRRLDRRSGRTLRTIASVGVALVVAAMACVPAQAQPAEPNPTLPHVYLQAGIHRIKAEVADSQAERSRGLMLRKSLQPNSGMLFVFDRAALHCFWMKNTLIPLTIAFLDDDGTIVTLADMQPHDESSHCPERPVRHALEMEQGWFKAKGLKAGDHIQGLR